MRDFLCDQPPSSSPGNQRDFQRSVKSLCPGNSPPSLAALMSLARYREKHGPSGALADIKISVRVCGDTQKRMIATGPKDPNPGRPTVERRPARVKAKPEE